MNLANFTRSLSRKTQPRNWVHRSLRRRVSLVAGALVPTSMLVISAVSAWIVTVSSYKPSRRHLERGSENVSITIARTVAAVLSPKSTSISLVRLDLALTIQWRAVRQIWTFKAVRLYHRASSTKTNSMAASYTRVTVQLSLLFRLKRRSNLQTQHRTWRRIRAGQDRPSLALRARTIRLCGSGRLVIASSCLVWALYSPRGRTIHTTSCSITESWAWAIETTKILSMVLMFNSQWSRKHTRITRFLYLLSRWIFPASMMIRRSQINLELRRRTSQVHWYSSITAAVQLCKPPKSPSSNSNRFCSKLWACRVVQRRAYRQRVSSIVRCWLRARQAISSRYRR